MKTQTSNTAVVFPDQTSLGSHKRSPYRTAFVRAVLLFTVMFGLSSCEVYPGGLGYGGGYGGGYGRNYSSGIARYANAYTSMYRSSGNRYSGYSPSPGYGYRPSGGSRHSSSYGLQHSFGQSFMRPSYRGGYGGFGGSHGGGRRH